LITKVIEEKNPYYFFDEIENFRKSVLHNEINSKTSDSQETQHRNYGALLSRLVNFFRCRVVIQVGGSTGLMSLYLASPLRKSCECFVLEENGKLLQALSDYIRVNQYPNLHLIEGDYNKNLTSLRERIGLSDLIFINLRGNAEKTEAAIRSVSPFIGNHTILIIDGITKDKAAKALWKRITEHPETRLTIDLIALGLVFFDKKLYKKNYKNYFDYGKKQDLHEKRRRRIHFVGGRKKGTKNKQTD
jgi:predicted O-methyltransferase YrrM